MIAEGANVNVRTKGGDSPLHLATRNGDLPVLTALLGAANADPKARNQDGNLTLHLHLSFAMIITE